MSDSVANHTSTWTIRTRVQILLPAEIIEKLSSVSKAISLMSSEPMIDMMNVTANGSLARREGEKERGIKKDGKVNRKIKGLTDIG